MQTNSNIVIRDFFGTVNRSGVAKMLIRFGRLIDETKGELSIRRINGKTKLSVKNVFGDNTESTISIWEKKI